MSIICTLNTLTDSNGYMERENKKETTKLVRSCVAPTQQPRLSNEGWGDGRDGGRRKVSSPDTSAVEEAARANLSLLQRIRDGFVMQTGNIIIYRDY